MANRERGEVAFKVNGTEHVLRFGINQLCDLEDALDMPVMAIVETMQDESKVRLGTARKMLQIGLSGHTALTELEAGDLIQDAGLLVTMEKIGEAVMLAFPEAEADENPTKGPATPNGSGSNS